MKESKIPVRNLYMMLAYCWEQLPISESVRLSSARFEDSSSFFFEIINHLLPTLIKKGLLKDYIEVTDESRSLRGKVNIGPTVKRSLLDSGRASCTFDSLSQDNTLNQIIKWALKILIGSKDINKTARIQLAEHLAHFEQTSDAFISKRLFQSIRFHRGNAYYHFIINLCELLYEISIPDDCNGNLALPNFLRDEKAMARLFEGFIRNFYRAEQTEYVSVRSETMFWNASGEDKALSFLPQMRTDITLSSKESIKIIDTKFYSNMFDDRYGAKKIKSENLYQLLSYLRAKSYEEARLVSGMLLYPDIGNEVNLKYQIDGFPVTVATVDLAADWDSVKKRLLDLLNPTNEVIHKKAI